jgi:phosphoenolpyruvate carboxylase
MNKYSHSTDEADKIDIMFRFIQYIERQIVLFDAVEDAAFPIVNNMEGRGSLQDIKEKADAKGRKEELIDFLENFNVRTVLTASYSVLSWVSLGIINDLTDAIHENLQYKRAFGAIRKNAFYKKRKANPFDEAVSLIWYLENVFTVLQGYGSLPTEKCI